jgi:hypothetical protein
MDPVARLDPSEVAVEPGGQASVVLVVRNRGTIVENFDLRLEGDGAGWSEVMPGELHIYPDEEAEATILFSPPEAGATAAGRVSFSVRATSAVDASVTAVADGAVTVAPVLALTATCLPATSVGARHGRHRIGFTNSGSVPVRLAVEASDPDEALRFAADPPFVDVPLSGSATVDLMVRPRRRHLWGVPRRWPFRVEGTPVLRADTPLPPAGVPIERPSAGAAFEQRPLLSRLAILIALVVVVLLTALILVVVLRPQAPDDFRVGTVTHDAMELVWVSGRRIDSYTLQRIKPETRNDENPVPDHETADLPGVADRVTVRGLQPQTEYCFRIVAHRRFLASAPTHPPGCATTGAKLDLPAPELTITRVAPDRARLTWTDPTAGAGTTIVLRDGAIVGAEVPPKVTSREEELLAGASNCFRVQSRLNGDTSELSAPLGACMPGPDESGGGGGGGGGGGETTTSEGGATTTVPELQVSAETEPSTARLPGFDAPAALDGKPSTGWAVRWLASAPPGEECPGGPTTTSNGGGRAEGDLVLRLGTPARLSRLEIDPGLPLVAFAQVRPARVQVRQDEHTCRTFTFPDGSTRSLDLEHTKPTSRVTIRVLGTSPLPPISTTTTRGQPPGPLVGIREVRLQPAS